MDLTTLRAKERHLKLRKNQPEIIKNVPLIDIAFYLEIKPYSLSSVRQERNRDLFTNVKSVQRYSS
jgi:hypothetical protein